MTTPIIKQGKTATKQDIENLRHEVLRMVANHPCTLNILCAALPFARTTVTKQCKLLELDGEIHGVVLERTDCGGELEWRHGLNPDPAKRPPVNAEFSRSIRKVWPSHNRRDDLVAAFFGPAKVAA